MPIMMYVLHHIMITSRVCDKQIRTNQLIQIASNLLNSELSFKKKILPSLNLKAKD